MPSDHSTDAETTGVRVVQAGLANRLILFGATLTVGALLIAILNDPFTQLLDSAAMISSVPQAETGRKWTRQMWEWAPFWIGLLGMIMLISGAVYERRRPQL